MAWRTGALHSKLCWRVVVDDFNWQGLNTRSLAIAYLETARRENLPNIAEMDVDWK